MTSVATVNFCGGCGYALRGLSEQGRCPECGKDYRPGELVLWGTVSAWRHSSVRAKVMQFSWIAGIVFTLLAASVGWGFTAYLALGIWGTYLVYVLYICNRRSQVRISPKGYGAHFGFGAVKVRPWKRDDVINLCRLRQNRYQFTIWRGVSAAVQIRIDMQDDDAEALRLQISAWSGQQVGLTG